MKNTKLFEWLLVITLMSIVLGSIYPYINFVTEVTQQEI
jgi:hypothetical protein